MEIEIGLDDVRLDNGSGGGVIEQAKPVNKAGITPIHELKFESPVELTRLRGQGSFEVDDHLVEEGLIRSVSRTP